jgi:Integrase zinc binding domain
VNSSSGRIWVPSVACELQQRLCVIAHAGAAGHRGINATIAALDELFEWASMAEDVSAFINGFLHCMMTMSGKIPRPLGETLHATKPNELIHFDFLCLYKSERVKSMC